MASIAIWFCLALLFLSTEYGDAAVSCESSLRIILPRLFTHCNDPPPCAYGPWSRWFYTGVLKSDSRCDSNKVRQHNRTRTAPASATPACKRQLRPEKQTKYECMCDNSAYQAYILYMYTISIIVGMVHTQS